MIRYGSSNAYAWAIHPQASPFRTGDNANRTDSIAEIGVQIVRNTNGFPYVVKGGMGQRWDHFSLVCWQYADANLSPEIWVVRRSNDEVSHVWEAESRFDPKRDTDVSPMITTMQNGRSIIPDGGSNVKCYFPSSSVLSSLETDVQNASLPSWVTNSVYDHITTTTNLLKRIFRESQRLHALKEYDDLDALFAVSMLPKQINLYKLLWMREASRILYDYRGTSCIELIMNKLRVDSNGVVSYAV